MDAALAPYYARVADKMSEAEFEARLRDVATEFDNLLDDEAIALLVLDEMGLNEGAFVTLSELSGRPEATVRATIDRIEPPREFQREGRPPGRVCNCAISDATGQARLVLWDRDVEKTEDGTLKPGARVTLVNARVKESRWGIELHVGPWTAIEVEGALTAAQRKLLQDVQAEPENATGAALPADAAAPEPAAPRSVRGMLVGVTATRTYKRPDGRAGFLCDVDLDTPEGRVRVVAWDEHVRAARALKPMTQVLVENVVVKARGAQNELHTTSESILRAAD